jgi:hypothetical protein
MAATWWWKQSQLLKSRAFFKLIDERKCPWICISLTSVSKAFSHWGDATAIRSRKKSTTLNSWRIVIASWSRWWEKRHYELKFRPVGDCRVIFFPDRIAVASPQWENGLMSWVNYVFTNRFRLIRITKYRPTHSATIRSVIAPGV